MPNLKQDEIEIVTYIGGSVLQKKSKKKRRLLNTNTRKQVTLDFVKTLTQNDMSSNWSNPGANKLIEVKNRGGLLTPSNIMVTFFVKLEQLFRHVSVGVVNITIGHQV